MTIKKVKLIQAQRLVEMFQHEMECLELRLFGKMQLEKKAIICGKRNETMNQGSQTQLKDVNFGLQQVFSKPIKFQVMVLKQDQDIQTDINSNIYDYMIKATATYERILQSGQPIIPQENFDEDDDDQIKKLVDLENTDAIMFSRRKNFASKALTLGIAEVDRTMANRTLSPIQRSKTYVPVSAQFGIARTGPGEMITSDSDGNEKSRRRKIELKSTKLSPITPDAYGNDTRETPLSINRVELGSKLESENKKDRSFNSSPNSMPFAADISSPTNDMQVLAHINQITQLNPEQLQKIFFNHDWTVQMQKEKSIKDLKAQADQKTAMDCFEMYVELLQVIKDLEPESFKNAIMIIKQKKFPDFELKPISHIKQLYPDFVPDVYTRLWETRLEPKETLERKRNYDHYRQQWANKLQDQKLLNIKSRRQPILTKNNRVQLNTIMRNHSSSPDMSQLFRNKSNVSSQRSHAERMSPIGIENQALMNTDIVKTLEEDVQKSKGILKGQSEVQILLQSVETLPNYNDSKPTSPTKMSDAIDESNYKSKKRLQSAKVQSPVNNRNQSSNERNLIEVHKNAKSQMNVFPTGQLHVKSFIQKVQSGSFKVQDISASTIRMRSFGQIKQVEKNLPTRNTTEMQSISDAIFQGRQNSDPRLKPSKKSFAVSVSQLKPYYPQDQETKVKPTRPVTSKGRSNTFMPLFDGQQKKQSETRLANGKIVSEEQSHRPLTGTTTNITYLGKELASRVSVVAGGGFNPMMFTRSGKDSKHPSDSSMTSLQPRKFSNQQTIRLKEFDGGFEKKTFKAQHHRFKKKEQETPFEYVNRLKFGINVEGIKVEQVQQKRNKIKRARPGTANVRVNHEVLSIPITMVPSGRKDHSDFNSNLFNNQQPQSSLKIENFVFENRHQHQRDNLQSNDLLEKNVKLMNIVNNTEKRSGHLFSNQMLTQQRSQHSIGTKP